MNELQDLEASSSQPELVPESPNLLDEIYQSEPEDKTTKEGATEINPENSVHLKTVDEGSLAELNDYQNLISEDESDKSELITDDLSGESEDPDGVKNTSDVVESQVTDAQPFIGTQALSKDNTSETGLADVDIFDNTDEEEPVEQPDEGDGAANDSEQGLNRCLTQTLSQPHMEFIPVIRTPLPALVETSTEHNKVHEVIAADVNADVEEETGHVLFEKDKVNDVIKENNVDKESHLKDDQQDELDKLDKDAVVEDSNSDSANRYGDEVETIEKINSFIEAGLNNSENFVAEEPGDLEGILSSPNVVLPVPAEDGEIVAASDNEDVIEDSDHDSNSHRRIQNHVKFRKGKLGSRAVKTRLTQSRSEINVVVNNMPSDVDSSDIELLRTDNVKVGRVVPSLTQPRRRNRNAGDLQRTMQMLSPETACCKRISTANGRVTPR